MHEFFGHEQTVNGVLFVPGTRLGVCSVSTDHSTKFWDAMTTGKNILLINLIVELGERNI